ncbi:hypothetical protein OSB04_015897 [Centaurea solstitialis]|uniref:NmrA-like domain-containing protein n=1 Tax=Centaurea solstitialis TaxID=347529 RepID=A0AA38W9B7_9ASTR|nr:hypothetical protein OSB04_015897 [Centaurea solstitialis]
MAEKSKILIIGGTGYIGKFVVEASAKSGHPTFLLVRESTLSDPSKSSLLESFKKSGVTFITGDLYDHGSLVKAIKQVDVVISTVGHGQLGDQGKIIKAIKEAGNIKPPATTVNHRRSPPPAFLLVPGDSSPVPFSSPSHHHVPSAPSHTHERHRRVCSTAACPPPQRALKPPRLLNRRVPSAADCLKPPRLLNRRVPSAADCLKPPRKPPRTAAPLRPPPPLNRCSLSGNRSRPRSVEPSQLLISDLA